MANHFRRRLNIRGHSASARPAELFELEAFERRILMAGSPAPQVTRPFTSTEIVVAFTGNTGRPLLQDQVNRDATVRKMVDLAKSTDMFKVSGTSLVEVKLRPGANVLQLVQKFSALPGVSWAQPNYIYDDFDPRDLTPNDPSYGSQYHHPKMQNNLAWDTTMGSPTVVLGITDDGFDTEHVDLFTNIWINQAEIPPTRLANLTDLNSDGYISMEELQDASNRGPFKANDMNADNRITASDLIALMVKDGGGNDTGAGGWTDLVDQGANTYLDDIVGRDFWNNDSDARPAAGNSHGTHVIGIAAGETNNATGISGTAGGISVMPIRFYSTSGGTWTSTIISNSYRYAANNGAKILSTSYNVDQFSTGPDAIFQAGLQYMYDAGVLHFNSQGNNPTLLNPPRQRWDQSIFVVSTNSSDVKASSSKYGWGADVSAPGDNIFSTLLNNTYGFNSGTSMATPNAAGVAALIWSLHPTWTREQVAAQVLATSDDISAQNPSIADLIGAGRVNSFRALNVNAPAPRVKPNTLVGLPAENGSTAVKPNSFTIDIRNIFAAATMNLSGFEMRGDGYDGIFGTADDKLIPMTLAFGQPSTPNYMIGTNRLNFAIPGAMAGDRYRFSALPSLTDPFGTPIDGNGDGTGGDAYTRTFTLTDFVPPKPLSSQFTFLTAQGLTVQFNEDVSDSLTMADLTLQNLTTSTPVDTSGFTLNYVAATNTATISFNTIIDDADYAATFASAGIGDVAGNALDGNGDGIAGDNLVVNFFFLQADANRDRNVNLLDFNILSSNYGNAGNFSNGDFNYDGLVNLADYNILSARYNNVLASGESETAGSPALGGSTRNSGAGAVQTQTRKSGAAGTVFSRRPIGILQSADQDRDYVVLLDSNGKLVLA